MYLLFNRYVAPQTIFLVLSETLLMFLTVLLTAAIRFSFSGSYVYAYDPTFLKTIVMTLTYTAVFYYFGLYSSEFYHPGRQMFMKLLQATAVSAVILFGVYFIFPSLKTWRGILLANIFLLPLGVVVWRRLLAGRLIPDAPEKRVLIIGTGDLARKIGTDIYRRRGHGLKLTGFIDDDPSKVGQSIVNPGVIGCFGDIADIVRVEKIERIIIALPDRRARLPMRALLDCKLKGVTVEEGETFEERMTGKIPLENLKPSWMVFSDGFKSLRTRKIMKRIFDLAISMVGLAVCAPVMLITAALIKLDSRGPVVFKQQRVGEHGREFNIYKFRSMKQDAESKTGPVWASTDDDRVTRIGRVIRKLRIDELPQLINIIKGDMSFVGPRPERAFFVDQLKEIIPYYEMRTVVKPGVTGWAQIKYPYGASVEDAVEKLQYDIYYIKNMSPLLDLMIFFFTIKVVLTGDGAR